MRSMTFSSLILKKTWRFGFALLAFGLIIMAPAVHASGPNEMSVGPDLLHNQKSFEKKLEDKWGVELTALRMTAHDHMVDFRYRVLDADKAAPLFKRQTKPYLIHQASGKALAVPNTAKVGALRNSNIPQKGRIYWMFFGNKGVVKSGDRVSVVIGDFRAENLVVD